ncbi:hypothetical protein NUU61_002731 [Penicillium alfredii]|uniref:Uncharacterized protein n=1 Tax=Penicillium alfredii TaxID=1506179 RepID=A0A9W9FS35_9EURO|nr:uncharacterized protein NUU61_002731 [Penicillium alfredii]KAJ5105384.1 hypothetical protein NUU61_002731 [Penicillium alfredii]
MQFYQAFLLSAAICLATTARADTNVLQDDHRCPVDWRPTDYRGVRNCCYGTLYLDTDDPHCCVVDHEVADAVTDTIPDAVPTFSDCFPFCSGSTGVNDVRTAASSVRTAAHNAHTSAISSCIDKVPLSASDYSSRVSAASSSARRTSPSTNDANPTATDSGDRWSTNAAMPIATAEGAVIGGVAVAAALFAL